MDIEILTHVNAALGRQYPAIREFNWATDVVSKGLKEQRNQRWSRPKREWLINWQALKITERTSLLELFNRAAGRYRTFKLLEVPPDGDFECAITECSITAAAAQVEFQLIKTYSDGETEEWNENKVKIVPSTTFAPVVKVDNVTKVEDTDFTLDDETGIVDFTLMGAPGDGAVVTANYRFYFEVRFADDKYRDIRNIPNHWQAEGIHLIEVVS